MIAILTGVVGFVAAAFGAVFFHAPGVLVMWVPCIVLIGLGVELAAGLAYLFHARPDRKSYAPSGDAVEVAARLRAHRDERTADPTAVR